MPSWWRCCCAPAVAGAGALALGGRAAGAARRAAGPGARGGARRARGDGVGPGQERGARRPRSRSAGAWRRGGCGPGLAIRGPADVYRHFHPALRHVPHERFLVVLLDGRHRVLRQELVSQGTLTASLVHPREVFRPALREAAAALILVHNHPSGDPTPSREDREVTARLRRAGELLGVPVLDHVVVAERGYRSLREDGGLDGGPRVRTADRPARRAPPRRPPPHGSCRAPSFGRSVPRIAGAAQPRAGAAGLRRPR